MKYIISKTEFFKPYFGQDGFDQNFYCRDLHTFFDLSCVEISEVLFDTIYPLLPVGYEEVSENEAKYGSWFFSEIRDQVKIMDVSTGWAETNAFPEDKKILFTLTDEIKQYVISFMYKFAKEIIDTEYNFRFKQLRNISEIESASWEIQKHEANEWLTYGTDPLHKTPFLDYLAEMRQIDKTELSNKILVNAEIWEDKLSTMLVEYQLLLRKFEKCTTIWDMNILYESYFGIMMPGLQAKQMGMMDENGVRIFELDGETMVDINNPKFGHKLNF